MLFILIGLFLAAQALNVYLLFRLRESRDHFRRELALEIERGAKASAEAIRLVEELAKAKAAPPRQESIELKEFLADLTGGKIGYVAVTRLNPDDFLLRSPKDR